MDKKKYAVAKVIDGVTFYYVRHPGTLSWHRGHFLGFWTRIISKATPFFDNPPPDYPPFRIYQTAKDFIVSVLSYTERVQRMKEWEETFNWTTNTWSLHYGRPWFNLKLTRWLYELPESGTKLASKGEIYYVDLDTGEKYYVHQIETDLSKYEKYQEHPGKKRRKENRMKRKEEEKMALDMNPAIWGLKKIRLKATLPEMMKKFEDRIMKATTSEEVEELERIAQSIFGEIPEDGEKETASS